MPAQAQQLLTILSEAVLEDDLVEAITTLGAKGYTITEARGRGAHGLRSGKWSAGANIRIEVVGDADLCARIVERIQASYAHNYGLFMFTTPVEVPG